MRPALGILSFCILLAPHARGADLRIPETIPSGLGVNIHFTDPKPGEMKMLADAGFTFIRMDLDWARTEKEKGVYDFSAYRRLLDALNEHNIRALLILDYANPLYDDNQSPRTDEGRKAFARWAAAAAREFKGRGVLWEMYNEPNIAPFWRPKPNTGDYIKLALEVGKAIRDAAPNELYIGPATSGIDLPFLESCFKADLLEYWDAVSVHPYRQVDPETVEDDYRDLRLLISRYQPAGKSIPILSGEWGYSSVWAGVDDERQGKLLARQWLVNLSQQIPLSIWYDWHDDGPDPKEPEHHFGTVAHAYHESRDPVYDAKRAYRAAQTLSRELRGFRFNKRLSLANPGDYMLLFDHPDGRVKVVAWTRSREPKKARLPARPGIFEVVSHVGQKLDPVLADLDGLHIKLTDAPVYLTPTQPNDLLQLAAAWERLPLEIVTEGDLRLRVALACTNVLDRELGVESQGAAAVQRAVLAPGEGDTFAVWLNVPRVGSEPPVRQRIGVTFGRMETLWQETALVVADAMSVTVLPRCGKYLPLRIDNPRGRPFSGSIGVSFEHGARKRTNKGVPGGLGAVDALKLEEGERERVLLRFAPPTPAAAEYHVSVSVAADDNQQLAAPSVFAARFRPILLDDSRLEVRAEGDADVKSQQSFSITLAPDGLPAPGAQAAKIDYRFDAGWKYVCLSPKPDPSVIEGTPTHLGMWVKGDGSGNILRLRFVDSTGQTFQPDGPKLDFTEWRYITFPMDGRRAGHWGGARDGVVHYPIALETILLIDSATRQETRGTVYVSSPTLAYESE